MHWLHNSKEDWPKYGRYKKMEKETKIDLYFYINKLVQYFRSIIILVIFSLSIGIIFIFFGKQNLQVTMEFNPIDESELYEFSILNKFDIIEFNPQMLLDRTIGSISDKLIFESIDELKIFDKAKYEIEDYNDIIFQEVGKFIIVKPIITKEDRILYQRTLNSSYRFIYETDRINDKKIIKSLYKNILSKAEKSVKEDYRNKVKNIIFTEKQWIKYKINDLSKSRENKINNYLNVSEKNIAILEENLRIANSLNLIDDVIINTSLQSELFKLPKKEQILTLEIEDENENDYYYLEDENDYYYDQDLYTKLNFPIYYFGSAAISEQIEIAKSKLEFELLNRDTINSKAINKINAEIQKYKNDMDIDRFEQAYLLTSLSDPEVNYNTIKYNISSVDIINQGYGTILILIISMGIGIVLSLIYVVLSELVVGARKKYNL